jgi:hypothetical protein
MLAVLIDEFVHNNVADVILVVVRFEQVSNAHLTVPEVILVVAIGP